jgi:hypothetical protein
VSANGTAPLSYQWRFNGAAIAGATNTALNLTNLQVSNAGNYSVTVSNLYGTTNSAPALLTVMVNPPTMSVSLRGGQLQISWPTNGPSFSLQETPSLSPPITWTNATNAAIQTNGLNVISIAPLSGNRFYRLALP